MKPNHKNSWKNPIFWSVAIMVSTSGWLGHCPSACGQENPPLSPITDFAVEPADFQKDISVPERLSLAAPDSPSGFQSEPAIDENTQPADDNAFHLIDIDKSASWFASVQQQFNGVDFPRVLGSLAIVLGGYLGFVWLTRRITPGAHQGLPQEVVEVLGQTAFGPKNSLQLVRLGSKLLLLLKGAEGTQTIGEITDPHEVEYLASLCGGKKNSSSAIAIRKASAAQSKSSAPSNPGGDLKRILRQLQQSGDNAVAGSVFDA